MTTEASQPSLELDRNLLSELKRIELRTRRSLNTDLMGSYRSAFRGTGLSFSELREYQPGDDVRHIHWKVTARSNKTCVKTFDEDRQLSIFLGVDISRSMEFGYPKTRYRKAVEFAAVLTTLARSSGDLVGLSLFSSEVESFYPPRGSRNQIHLTIAELLRARTLPERTDLSASLAHIRRHLRKTSIVFIISDFLDDNFELELRGLSHAHDVILVNLGTPQLDDLPNVGLVEYQDAETGERRTINTSNSRLRTRYQEVEKSRIERLESLARSTKADLIHIQDNILEPLSTLMKRRVQRVR